MLRNSHLAIAEPAYRLPGLPPNDPVANIILQAQTEDGAFSLIGKPNARGFLGQVIAEAIPAADAQDARTEGLHHAGEHLRSRGAREKFNQIINDHLRPVRDRIAHAVLDSGELTLSADEDLHIREIYRWLSLMKCLVRHMLKSDFPQEFLPYLNEKGEYIQ